MTIEGATVIRTGFGRGSGYDNIFLKTVDGRVIELRVENTPDGDQCIGISDVLGTLEKRISKHKEEINTCKRRSREIEKW